MVFAQVLLHIALCAGPQLAWESHTNFTDIAALCLDTSGTVICGATSGGLFTFSSGDTALLHHVTNAHGLPCIEASAAAAGPDGRAWIGTRGGGICAVGIASGAAGSIIDRNGGLISDTVLALAYWRSGGGDRLVAGMPGGLSLIDPATGEIVRSYYARYDTLLNSAVQALAIRGDTLWIGTDRRVVTVPFASINDPSAWTPLINQDIISLFAGDTMIVAGTPAGATRKGIGPGWQSFAGIGAAVRSVATVGDSVFFATSGGVKFFHAGSISELNTGLPSMNVKSLAKDRQGRLWAGTASGLSLLSGASWLPFRFNGLGGNNCNYVAVGGDEIPWVSHPTAGVSRLMDGEWQTFTQGTTGCPINHVTTIGCDPHGDAWFGSGGWGGGVSRFTRAGAWLNYVSPVLPTNYVTAFLPAGTTGMFFAHWDATLNDLISRWDRADSSWHVIWGPDTDIRPLCLALDNDGGLWVGTYGKGYKGLYRRTPAGAWVNWSTANSELPGDKVNALAVDKAGWVWAGTDNGLARYDGTAFRQIQNPDLGPKITAIAVDRTGNKWIGSDRGLFLLTWDGRWHAYNQRDTYATGSRLLSDNVTAIATARRDDSGDDVYVATDRGLSAIHCRAAGKLGADQPAVAPNPYTMASGSQIVLSRLPDRAAVRVYTIDGRLIASADGPAAPAHQLFLRFGAELPKDLPSGIYLVHVTPASGLSSTLKLVVLR